MHGAPGHVHGCLTALIHLRSSPLQLGCSFQTLLTELRRLFGAALKTWTRCGGWEGWGLVCRQDPLRNGVNGSEGLA